MTIVRHRTFTGEARWQRLEDAAFEGCTFDNCLIRRPRLPAGRAVARNIRLTNVSHRSCWVNGLAIEEATLDSLKAMSDMPLFLFGCVFTHVTLTGSVSHIKFNSSLDAGSTPEDQQQWSEANSAYYSGVDWALDISKARFTSVIDLEAFPGSLIRRDPDTQVLVRRDTLLNEDWQSVNFGNTVYDMLISSFVHESSLSDMVLMAARGNRRFKEQMAVLEEMRSRGLAE